jgi:ribosomal protein L18E
LSLPQSLKSDLEFSSELSSILRKVSNEVTEFTRKVCWELNLDRYVRANISLSKVYRA